MTDLPISEFSIFASGLDHPECLAFDRCGRLWAGGEAGQIYCIAPDGAVRTVGEYGGFSGGIALAPSGELLVCNPAHGLLLVKENGESRIFAAGLTCPNFPLFAPDGALIVTDSGRWRTNTGRVLRFSAGGAPEELLGPMGYANGLALDAARGVLYVVESDTRRVLALELATGNVSVRAEEVGRMPDGVVLDAGGHLLVGCYASDDIWLIPPDGPPRRFARDPDAILLNRPTNLVLREGYLYAANFGRTTITRARTVFRAQEEA